jgi:hypothetical protein
MRGSAQRHSLLKFMRMAPIPAVQLHSRDWLLSARMRPARTFTAIQHQVDGLSSTGCSVASRKRDLLHMSLVTVYLFER